MVVFCDWGGTPIRRSRTLRDAITKKLGNTGSGRPIVRGETYCTIFYLSIYFFYPSTIFTRYNREPICLQKRDTGRERERRNCGRPGARNH